ncbi:cAMP-binding protein [Fulvivirga imtechensis AK7]|uniref:cAMP-binding protein n=1 Tax=Fulvivirga imtechensis AK7 TaxID=1237149 RepID=L8JN03_9BACT|nr:Crp/Fnr family transcriptional regulator [Fulvivirga imtechensis]ELR70215.1 cAMP-binding protein [Fulvivirga imtechensis AK7]
MDFSLIIDNINKHISLNSEEQDYFTSLLEVQQVKRRAFLVRKGEIARYTYFITKGCLRNYEIDREGTIHIGLFAVEDWWISDLQSFLTQTPSFGFVDAIEETEVMRLSKSNYESLFEKVPQFERFFRIIHQNAFIALKNRLIDNLSLTAEGRYLNFIDKYPQFNQRIPQKQIAAYLGITPEFLSMLRSRMARRS